jgi:hypothetical protein
MSAMKTMWVIVILVVILLIVFSRYRSHRSDQLNVDPAAREEIEKAKRR